MQLHEVILYVQNMQLQVAFYRDLLGLQLVTPADEDNLAEAYWVVFETGGVHLALHGGGTRQFGVDAPKLVFRVNDLPAERERLLKLGVAVGEIRSPAPGIQVCDFEDAEGNPLSLEFISGTM